MNSSGKFYAANVANSQRVRDRSSLTPALAEKPEGDERFRQGLITVGTGQRRCTVVVANSGSAL
jgi:hypothetical protein